jgi:hypothetical protein
LECVRAPIAGCAAGPILEPERPEEPIEPIRAGLVPVLTYVSEQQAAAWFQAEQERVPADEAQDQAMAAAEEAYYDTLSELGFGEEEFASFPGLKGSRRGAFAPRVR